MTVGGRRGDVAGLFSAMEAFNPMFNIVTPQKRRRLRRAGERIQALFGEFLRI